MLLEDFEKWRISKNNHSILQDENSEENFGIFFQHYTVGKGWFEMVADLGWQIHQLQVCVENLLEEI